MIRIEARIVGTEAIVRLDTLPHRFQDILLRKMENFLEGMAKPQLLAGVPGKFIDPKYVRADVARVGSLLIGSIEGEQKPGTYTIFPTKANILRFVSKSGELVFAKYVTRHPFMNPNPTIERFFAERKPWLVDQIEDLVFEAVYNAR